MPTLSEIFDFGYSAQAFEDFLANLFLYKFLLDKNPSAALLTSQVGSCQ
jgi:hypothetical protein